jgi:hypothetical protein
MNNTAARKLKQGESWPRKVSFGRETITVYRRKTPLGNFAFMVANYSGQKRRFDSYGTEADAMDAAGNPSLNVADSIAQGLGISLAQMIKEADAIRKKSDRS